MIPVVTTYGERTNDATVPLLKAQNKAQVRFGEVRCLRAAPSRKHGEHNDHRCEEAYTSHDLCPSPRQSRLDVGIVGVTRAATPSRTALDDGDRTFDAVSHRRVVPRGCFQDRHSGFRPGAKIHESIEGAITILLLNHPGRFVFAEEVLKGRRTGSNPSRHQRSEEY